MLAYPGMGICPPPRTANGISKEAKIKMAMDTSNADSGFKMQAGAR